ncbi:hypothetical protein OIU79_021013 [Salix purpurea]|uniref:Uncharacterized protein n=1 Tax=Salix purpurea TaxID=77065 RepID=A0A9Q1AGG8_SALPP|nr:hypothetical protein OIU79_021013 [Salix purpurea]
MAKNKRKPPAAAVKRAQSLHAPVPSHTNQGGSLVPGYISAPGHGTNTARELDGSPVDKSKLDGSPVDNSTTNGSPVDNTNASLDTVLEEGCPKMKNLEKNILISHVLRKTTHHLLQLQWFQILWLEALKSVLVWHL